MWACQTEMKIVACRWQFSTCLCCSWHTGFSRSQHEIRWSTTAKSYSSRFCDNCQLSPHPYSKRINGRKLFEIGTTLFVSLMRVLAWESFAGFAGKAGKKCESEHFTGIRLQDAHLIALIIISHTFCIGTELPSRRIIKSLTCSGQCRLKWSLATIARSMKQGFVYLPLVCQQMLRSWVAEFQGCCSK